MTVLLIFASVVCWALTMAFLPSDVATAMVLAPSAASVVAVGVGMMAGHRRRARAESDVARLHRSKVPA
jgi:hypothetical protein